MTKYLECPDCHYVFKSPKVDLKYTIGYTIPGLGLVECPKCKTKARRKNYVLHMEMPPEANVTHTSSSMQESPKESDLIEESRFEDE